MDISVIIPSFNTQDCIAGTLRCIKEQNPLNLDIEILVIDCSEHDQVKAVASQVDGVKYHHETTRFNPGIGRNIGAHLALGRLLIFIDADVALEEGALENAWRHHQEGYPVFGGALELNKDTAVGAASYLEHYFFNHESQKGRPAQKRNNLSSALMCFDRDLFINVGGFKDIPRMQDTELTERLRGNGIDLWFFPDIAGLQTQDSPLKKVFGKIFVNGQNLYYIRYRPSITAVKKMIFFFLLPLMALLKTTRIFARNLRYQQGVDRLCSILTLPLLLAGGCYWMAGFYQAMISEKGIANRRD